LYQLSKKKKLTETSAGFVRQRKKEEVAIFFSGFFFRFFLSNEPATWMGKVRDHVPPVESGLKDLSAKWKMVSSPSPPPPSFPYRICISGV
jgi:hypothetical protein